MSNDERTLYLLSIKYHALQGVLDSITGENESDGATMTIAEQEVIAEQYWEIAGNEPEPPVPGRRAPPPQGSLPPPLGF